MTSGIPGRDLERRIRGEPCPGGGCLIGLQVWIDARQRHHLSHAHVQMARELGMNPKKLGGLDNHRQEPWKLPLPEFIEHLYSKRFGKRRPDVVVSIEDRVRMEKDRKAVERKMRRRRSGDDAQG